MGASAVIWILVSFFLCHVGPRCSGRVLCEQSRK